MKLPAASTQTRIEVAFTPALLTEPAEKVSIIIDALRFSSAAVTMFGRGLHEALVVETIAEARRRAKADRGLLLCGEEGGLPPRGFDYGNSPAEFSRLNLTGRRAVVATTNGTVALARAAPCPVVLVGALLNRRAAARGALQESRARRLDITLVCAGERRTRSFSLEDAFCAGALVAALIEGKHGASSQLCGSARAALRLYRSYRGSARAAFRESDHGKSLLALGLGPDLEFCAQADRYAVVPRLHRAANGTLLLRSS